MAPRLHSPASKPSISRRRSTGRDVEGGHMWQFSGDVVDGGNGTGALGGSVEVRERGSVTFAEEGVGRLAHRIPLFGGRAADCVSNAPTNVLRLFARSTGGVLKRGVALALTAMLMLPLVARAQAPHDHLKCYKMKDSLNLGGTADLNTAQFGADPGCKISKAALFCVAATKTNVAVTNKKTKDPIVPLPITGAESDPLPGNRICYKIKCPNTPPQMPDQSVTDQFGNRMISNSNASLICTPAFNGEDRFVDNGNSITDNYTGLQWME